MRLEEFAGVVLQLPGFSNSSNKERRMYGSKPPVVAGLSLLPATGSNRALFITAVTLIAAGVVTFVVATVLGRKARRSEAN